MIWVVRFNSNNMLRLFIPPFRFSKHRHTLFSTNNSISFSNKCNNRLQFLHSIQTPTPRRYHSSLVFRQELSSIKMKQISESIVEVHNDITKSPSDTSRDYRGLVLTNGLTVLLISDPTTEKAAAAMDVNVGSMSDPDNLPGLAHFCEHMLFLGTTKYPDENAYNVYLSKHAGSSNAYTASDHTNYHFDVGWEHLHGALDRFAQFFISPLFNEDVKDREINAVNSENQQHLSNDVWRIHMVEKSTARKGHSFSRFSTGNLETLGTIPEAAGIDVREELLKFHKCHYSSNIMCLTVLGRESLDTLTETIVELFSNIMSTGALVPNCREHPFGVDEVKKKIEVIPVKDVRNLIFKWPTTDYRPYYKDAPGHYLSHLIGHEGPGSLLSLLKGKGWCNSLSAGHSESATNCWFFTLMMDLTEEGLKNTNEIAEYVFQYLTLLQNDGINDWVWDELKSLSEIQFRFKDKEQPVGYVSKLASYLQHFPMHDIVSNYYLLGNFNTDLIKGLLAQLVPDNVRMGIISQSFEGLTNSVEKWLGAHYSLKDIDNDTLINWNQPVPHTDLCLPKPNAFIAKDFSIFGLKSLTPSVPELLINSPLSKVWYKQDDTFLLPKAYFKIEFYCPIAFSTPLNVNCLHMFDMLINDSLQEYSYDAALAGLSYNLIRTSYGFQLSIKGYNEKQPAFLSAIMNRLVNFEPLEERFNILIEEYSRALENFKAEQPYSHAMFYTSLITMDKGFSKEELKEALPSTNRDQLIIFHKQLLEKLHIESLLFGNINESSARDINKLVTEYFTNSNVVLPSDKSRVREIVIEPGEWLLYQAENEVHPNNCVEIYYQTGLQNVQTNCLLELVGQIVQEPCFNELRTKQQLGYIVHSGLRRSNSVQGFRVLVQSMKGPVEVEKCVDEFIKSMDAYIEGMDSFDEHVDALVTKRLEKPKKMGEESSKHFTEIVCQHYQFDRDEVEVEFLKTVTKEQVLKFFKEFISGPKRRKFSTHIISTALDDVATTHTYGSDEGTTKKPTIIKNIHDFKASRIYHELNTSS